MKLNFLWGAAVAAGLIAAPAVAQKPGERGRGGVAGEIAREIENAADAIGTVTDAFSNSVGRVRWRSAERDAIARCAPRVERYGKIHVDAVEPYGRRSLRVYGRTEGRSDYYRGRGYGPRAFACTVRDDGRVKLSTRRLT
jgi:hypothetical protein